MEESTNIPKDIYPIIFKQSFIKYFNNMCPDAKFKENENSTTVYLTSDSDKSSKITINYNPNENFNIHEMITSYNNGLLSYLLDIKSNIINSILSLKYYNKDNCPSDFEEKWYNYDIVYTVGDFEVHVDYYEANSKLAKPLCTLVKLDVDLPLKIEYIKKNI